MNCQVKSLPNLTNLLLFYKQKTFQRQSRKGRGMKLPNGSTVRHCPWIAMGIHMKKMRGTTAQKNTEIPENVENRCF